MNAATIEAPAPTTAEEIPSKPPVGGFIAGVLASQVVNNALHLAQPLLIMQLSGSLGKAALFSSFDTAVHMAGTLLGGWPADRIGARRLLILSTFLRGAALALIPALWLAGRLTLILAMAAYTLDALVRGFTDTAAHTLPLCLADGQGAELDRLNSRYEFAFDLGGVAGPLLLGVLMISKKGLAPHIAIPLGFVAASLMFFAVPKETNRVSSPTGAKTGGTLSGARLVLSSARLLWPCLGLALLNLYPLRKLMSAFFAKAILSQPSSAAWVGAAFGLGGALGSLFYNWRSERISGPAWVAAGAVGVLALAAGCLPGSLWFMMAAAFAFSLVNVGARLAVTRRLQEATPMSAAGGVTSVARFASNGVSVVLKALLGAAFAFGSSPRQAFAVIAGSLALLALTQFGLASNLTRD
jgi:predicted MFS family arabinose efflux permease